MTNVQTSNPISAEPVDPLSMYNEQKINDIFERTREIKRKCRQLEEGLRYKLDALIGPVPVEGSGKTGTEPNCWVDMVISEQLETLEIINDTIIRMESL